MSALSPSSLLLAPSCVPRSLPPLLRRLHTLDPPTACSPPPSARLPSSDSLTFQLQHRNQLDYFTSPSSSYPSVQDAIDNMLDEQVWAAITINSGATSNLQSARQGGDASYNGSSAISIYYAQARNEMAMNQYVVPYIQQALWQITARIGSESVAQ